MDKNKDIGIVLAMRDPIKYKQELEKLAQADPEILNTIYRELWERLGPDAAVELYETFKGQQISFPLRFLSPEKVHDAIVREYDGTNIRQLTARYGYSEKTVRRIIKAHFCQEKKGKEK